MIGPAGFSRRFPFLRMLLAHGCGTRACTEVRERARDWIAYHGGGRAGQRQMIERRWLEGSKACSIGIGAGGYAGLIAGVGNGDYIIPASLRGTDVVGFAARSVRARGIRNRLILAVGERRGTDRVGI